MDNRQLQLIVLAIGLLSLAWAADWTGGRFSGESVPHAAMRLRSVAA